MKNQPAAWHRKLLRLGGRLAWVMWMMVVLPAVSRGQDGKREAASAKETEAVLLKLDADFSKLSEQKGVQTAFLTFMSDTGTLLAPGAAPIVGKEDLRDLLSGEENTRLTWTPQKAEVSGAGDMGYTYGKYESRRERKNAPAKITRGKYVTVWRKQADGGWKAVLDIGSVDSTSDPAGTKTP